MKAMICRNCGAGLEADRIDTSLGVVSCSHCGSLHETSATSADEPSSGNTSAAAVKPTRLDVTLPSRYKVRRGTNSMEIIWPAGGVIHGVVLSIMAVAIAHAALTSGMLFLLIASVGLAYLAAARAFNKHHIRVDGARLQIDQGPLPWPGSRKVDSADITQLYATEHESRTESGGNGNRKIRIRKYYRLSANTRNNGRITILKGFSDPLQTLWLEQEIERLLGISDKHVTGEHTL